MQIFFLYGIDDPEEPDDFDVGLEDDYDDLLDEDWDYDGYERAMWDYDDNDYDYWED